MKRLQLIKRGILKFKRIFKLFARQNLKQKVKLLQTLLMAEAIEYVIKDKGSYASNIGYIMEKNPSKKWVCETPQAMITINLEMKRPTYLTRVQARGYQTDIIQIIFQDIDGQHIDSMTINFEGSLKDNVVQRNISHSQMTSFVELRLRSANGQPKLMGLNFIFFRGQNNPLKPSKQAITNLTKQHNINKVKLDTFKQQQTKSKPIQVSRPFRNLTKPVSEMFNQRFKRNNEKQKEDKNTKRQDDQIQKAIKESQKTYQQQMKSKNLTKETNIDIQNEQNKQDSDTMPLMPQRTYQVASYESMKDSIKFLNSRYLEAQRKAQLQIGVKEQQRLSNYIEIKHLHNREVYIDKDTIKGQRKAKLQSIAEKLGAKIITNPKNYCLMISTAWEHFSVQSAITKFHGIKAINEDYLIECKKVNAQLDWKDYSLKK